MPSRTPINLDELEDLNPEPQVFQVGGRELILKDLSHVQFFRAEQMADDIQKGVSSKDFSVGELQAATNRLLMLLYEPHNRWLTEEDDRAHEKAVNEWRERHPDGRAPEDGSDSIPRRSDFCGGWFDCLSQPKLVYLTTKAFDYQRESVIAAQSDTLVNLPNGVNEADLPPQLAAARQAALERRSPGATSTNS